MQPIITLPLLKFMYLISKNKKVNKICVINGGKMTEEQWNRDDIKEFIKR